MAETKGKLYLAFKKEKDPKMRSRMLAVHMVRNRGLGVEETAENRKRPPLRSDSVPDLPRLIIIRATFSAANARHGG